MEYSGLCFLQVSDKRLWRIWVQLIYLIKRDGFSCRRNGTPEILSAILVINRNNYELLHAIKNTKIKGSHHLTSVSMTTLIIRVDSLNCQELCRIFPMFVVQSVCSFAWIWPPAIQETSPYCTTDCTAATWFLRWRVCLLLTRSLYVNYGNK